LGKPELRPDIRKQLNAVAIQSLERFVDWLDFNRTRVFREQVAHLYQGLDAEQAVWQLRHHPWREIILDGDELRSEALGMAAREVLLREAIVEGRAHSAIQTVVDRAQSMYQTRQFEGVLRLLDAIPHNTSNIQARITQLHSDIMANLYSSDGESMGADANWTEIVKSTDSAIRYVNEQCNNIRGSELLIERYEHLQRVARIIDSISRCVDRAIRLVDILAGLKDSSDPYPQVAALLLVTQFEAACSTPGDTTACLLALPLPEQIYRVWAFWALGLNFYQAPSFAEEIHLDANAAWLKRGKGDMQRPVLGKSFPSSAAFAYYCLSFMQRQSIGQAIDAPEKDYPSLDRALASFELRNDTAHAITLTRKSARKQFFELINRWLNCLIEHCPVKTSRAELKSLIEPLPLVDQNRELIWF
jgi:hypothetical protein